MLDCFPFVDDDVSVALASFWCPSFGGRLVGERGGGEDGDRGGGDVGERGGGEDGDRGGGEVGERGGGDNGERGGDALEGDEEVRLRNS